jgi:hypothetical protein
LAKRDELKKPQGEIEAFDTQEGQQLSFKLSLKILGA